MLSSFAESTSRSQERMSIISCRSKLNTLFCRCSFFIVFSSIVRNNFRFTFCLTDSLIASALQDAPGHAISPKEILVILHWYAYGADKRAA